MKHFSENVYLGSITVWNKTLLPYQIRLAEVYITLLSPTKSQMIFQWEEKYPLDKHFINSHLKT